MARLARSSHITSSSNRGNRGIYGGQEEQQQRQPVWQLRLTDSDRLKTARVADAAAAAAVASSVKEGHRGSGHQGDEGLSTDLTVTSLTRKMQAATATSADNKTSNVN